MSNHQQQKNSQKKTLTELRQQSQSKVNKTKKLFSMKQKVVLGLVALLACILIFSTQIALLIMRFNMQPGEGLKPVYDTSDAKPITLLNALEVMHDKSNIRPEGQISIPSIDLNLDIYEGLNNSHLMAGAGEQYPRSEVYMGDKGKNYVLASHQTGEDKLLFGPLHKTELGKKIYVTDAKTVYVYKVIFNDEVLTSDTTMINEKPSNKNDSWITLYTCSFNGQQYRRVVRGELSYSYEVDNAKNSQLQPFFNKKNEYTGYTKYYYTGHY